MPKRYHYIMKKSHSLSINLQPPSLRGEHAPGSHRNLSPPLGLRIIFSLTLAGLLFCFLPHAFAAESLVVYSGRAERLIQPVLDAFHAKTGIHVKMLTGSSTALLNRLQAEGSRTPADVFITNDAGTLERARNLHLLRPMEIPEIKQAIPEAFRAPDNSWVGLSGRIWVVAYNTNLVDPGHITSILDLADPKWKGKIAIPNAGSVYLQSGISVIRAVKGESITEQFLKGLKANAGTFVYGKNRQIVDAVARGEVALGLVNHYYIFRHLAKHHDAPIALHITDQDNGMGLIMNTTGIGVITYTKHLAETKALVQFLVSSEGQKMFANLNKEYPLRPGIPADPALPPRKSFHVANVPLTRLAELRDPTMTAMEHIGLR